MSLCAYVEVEAHMCVDAHRGLKMVSSLLEQEVQVFVSCLMLVLESELQSHNRTASTQPLSHLSSFKKNF